MMMRMTVLLAFQRHLTGASWIAWNENMPFVSATMDISFMKMNDYVLIRLNLNSTPALVHKTNKHHNLPFALQINFEEPHGRIGKVRREGQDI